MGKRTNCIPSTCPLLPQHDGPPPKNKGWEKNHNFMDNPSAVYSKLPDPVAPLSERPRELHRVQSDTWLVLNKALCCLRIFTARPQMSLQVTLVARQSILTLKIQGKVNFCVFSSQILLLLLKTSHNRQGLLFFPLSFLHKFLMKCKLFSTLIFMFPGSF